MTKHDRVAITQMYASDSYDETVADGTAIDIDDMDGNMLVTIDAEAATGTTPTVNLAIQDRTDADDSWAAVTAAALYNLATGAAATFAEITDAAASLQTLGLKRNLLKAQVRAVLTIAGTTPDCILCVHLTSFEKLTDWIQQ